MGTMTIVKYLNNQSSVEVAEERLYFSSTSRCSFLFDVLFFERMSSWTWYSKVADAPTSPDRFFSASKTSRSTYASRAAYTTWFSLKGLLLQLDIWSRLSNGRPRSDSTKAESPFSLELGFRSWSELEACVKLSSKQRRSKTFSALVRAKWWLCIDLCTMVCIKCTKQIHLLTYFWCLWRRSQTLPAPESHSRCRIRGANFWGFQSTSV